jgi:hypothetical protein
MLILQMCCKKEGKQHIGTIENNTSATIGRHDSHESKKRGDAGLLQR